MRKYFVGFLTILSISALATTASRAQISGTLAGFRLGTSFANQSSGTTTDGTTSGMKFGILGGAQVEHWFNDNWGIGLSLLYDQKGVSETYSEGSINHRFTDPARNIDTICSGTDDFTFNYIVIPIHLKYALGYGDVKPYVFVGTSFGMLLSGSDKTTGMISALGDMKPFLQSLDISIDFGAGFMDRFYNGPTFFFDAGYSAGISNIYKSNPPRTITIGGSFPNPIDHSTAKSGDIRIGLGAMWPM